jgi:NADH-quinone oxidoreductase subunit N
MLLAGAAMMLVGFGFKVATAPFHIWSPDVYEGAPTPVTALLSTGPKAAAFAGFARVFILTFAVLPLADLQSASTGALVVMAALTMTVGNLVAIVQTNIKRMLAYSSIAHAGYAMVGMAAGDWRAVAFYLLGYVVINIGALAIVEVIAERGDIKTRVSDYAGIGFKSLGVASALSLFLLSLAGLPLTAGFMGKFLVFKSAWGAGFHALVVIAVINSAISWYYYLRVIVVMFFGEPSEQVRVPAPARPVIAALLLIVLATLYLGVAPDRVLKALERAGDQVVVSVGR